ncbi:MAG: protein kinase domain-containing protein [Candidatus Sericytochromatia bacterium]
MYLNELLELLPPHQAAPLQQHYQNVPEGVEKSLDDWISEGLRLGLLEPASAQAIYLQEGICLSRADALPQLTASPLYALLDILGKGAMGTVHLARDRALQRKVAYKQLLPNMEGHAGVLRRFLHEVQITAQLDHPHIVPIYSLENRPDGSLSYAMKRVRGHTLKELIQASRAAWDAGTPPGVTHRLETLLHHFLKVCDAMAYAHRKGVIHRDLKPANLMVGDFGEVYVMDWGIARLISTPETSGVEVPETPGAVFLTGEDDSTQLGQILGTPRYMSPQQAAGKNNQLDGRSDLFALGLILFEIATLKPAFTARDSMGLLKQVLKAELQPCIPYAGPPVAAELQAIIRLATQRHANQRYANVEALAQDLRRFLRGEAVQAEPDPLLRRVLRWTRQHRRGVLLTILSLLILGSTLTLGGLYRYQLELRQAQTREQALGSELARLASQAQLLEGELLGYAGLLEQLSTTALISLAGPEPSSPARIYRDTDFDTPGQAPRDYHLSPRYERAISLSWPVFRLPSASLKPFVQRLAPLKTTFQGLFLESAGLPKQQADISSLKKAVEAPNVYLAWSYLALQNGLHLAYPGKGGYPRNFDPRTRPWFQQSRDKRNVSWSAPYADALGQGLLITASLPLYNQQDQFQGVAGLDLRLENWARDRLPVPGSVAETSGIRRLLLLNAAGQVLIDVAQQPGQATAALAPRLLEQLKPALQRGQSGYREITADSTAHLLIYTQLPTLNWFYVADLDPAVLYRRGRL